MYRVYDVHIHLPELLSAMREALEDLYNVDTTVETDPGRSYICMNDEPTDTFLMVMRVFCDGYSQCYNHIFSKTHKA